MSTPGTTTVIAPTRLAYSSLPSPRSTRHPWSPRPLTGFYTRMLDGVINEYRYAA